MVRDDMRALDVVLDVVQLEYHQDLSCGQIGGSVCLDLCHCVWMCD